jgi:hypothetical protein
LWVAVLLVGSSAGCVRGGFEELPIGSDQRVDLIRDRGPADQTGDSAPADLRRDSAPADLTAGQQELVITDNLDDGQITDNWTDEWLPNGEPGGIIFAGHFISGGVAVWGYLRFELAAAIPAGSVVDHAHVHVFGRATHKWNSAIHALRISLEDSADAAQVTSELDAPDVPSGRAEVPSIVRWPPSGGLTWPTGVTHVSPDLGSLFQQLIDARGGLAKGAHVQLWLRHIETDLDAEVGMDDFSRQGGTPARLTLQFEP